MLTPTHVANACKERHQHTCLALPSLPVVLAYASGGHRQSWRAKRDTSTCALHCLLYRLCSHMHQEGTASRGALLHFLNYFLNPPPLLFRRIPRASRGALLQLRAGRTCTGAAAIASRTRDAPARIRARATLRLGSHTLPASLR